MARISWEKPLAPRYEIGVDRGVLKIEPTGSTQAWNGLISVDEQPPSTERNDNFFDGVKISESFGTRDWQATIRAFSWPKFFYPALGWGYLTTGFYFARQPRKEFSLSYRTLVGDGSYKLRLVYNALISGSLPARRTLTDTPEPDTHEILVNATPTIIDGITPSFKPVAHFVIDSSKTDPDLLTELEDILYGVAGVNPRFPTAFETANLMKGL